MDEPRLSLSEYAVLGLLAEGPSHGFAIARELSVDGSIGQVLTVRRSLAYRALDRLVSDGLARPTQARPALQDLSVACIGSHQSGKGCCEPGSRPRYATCGRCVSTSASSWCCSSAPDVSPLPLIRVQRDALEPAFRAIGRTPSGPVDHVELLAPPQHRRDRRLSRRAGGVVRISPCSGYLIKNSWPVNGTCRPTAWRMRAMRRRDLRQPHDRPVMGRALRRS